MKAIADLAATGLAGEIVSRDSDLPAGWNDNSRDAADRRRLSRAVRPHQPEDLPWCDPKGEVLNGGEVPRTALLQPVDVDHTDPLVRR